MPTYTYIYILCVHIFAHDDRLGKSGNLQEANDKYAKDISISNGIGTLAQSQDKQSNKE